MVKLPYAKATNAQNERWQSLVSFAKSVDDESVKQSLMLAWPQSDFNSYKDTNKIEPFRPETIDQYFEMSCKLFHEKKLTPPSDVCPSASAPAESVSSIKHSCVIAKNGEKLIRLVPHEGDDTYKCAENENLGWKTQMALSSDRTGTFATSFSAKGAGKGEAIDVVVHYEKKDGAPTVPASKLNNTQTITSDTKIASLDDATRDNYYCASYTEADAKVHVYTKDAYTCARALAASDKLEPGYDTRYETFFCTFDKTRFEDGEVWKHSYERVNYDEKCEGDKCFNFRPTRDACVRGTCTKDATRHCETDEGCDTLGRPDRGAGGLRARARYVMPAPCDPTQNEGFCGAKAGKFNGKCKPLRKADGAHYCHAFDTPDAAREAKMHFMDTDPEKSRHYASTPAHEKLDVCAEKKTGDATSVCASTTIEVEDKVVLAKSAHDARKAAELESNGATYTCHKFASSALH